jgi:hypothetical protein
MTDEPSKWEFLDFQTSNKYIPYLSQEYDPLKPHDYHKVVDLVRRFKRDLNKLQHDDESQKDHDIQPLSSKAALLKSEDGEDAYRRRGGIDQPEQEDLNSTVLLFYRIETSDEREIKARILKLVEPFGKILEIMLDRVPAYVGLPPEDNLRVYVKFKDSSSSRKGKSNRSNHSILKFAE